MQNNGIGIRRAEGFGQVLFMSAAMFEGLTAKKPLDIPVSGTSDDGDVRRKAEIRRAGYSWVRNHAPLLYDGGLSKSQLGSIQALCEKAMSAGGDTAELDTFFRKNLEERGARLGERFTAIDALVRSVLHTPLKKTIGIRYDCDDTVTQRLRLLCLLFDYSRKGKDGEAE